MFYCVRCNVEFPLDEKRANEAYNALVGYLAICQRSEKECREKLYDKGYHRDEVEFAISKAKRYRYINDEEYVRAYIAFNKQKYGIKKIAYKLTAEKGIDKNLVDNLIADGVDGDFEMQTCRQFAEKYVKQKHIEDKSQLRKVTAFLYQKGFEWRVINAAICDLFDVDGDFS